METNDTPNNPPRTFDYGVKRLLVRREAEKAFQETYIWDCHVHGETLYDVKSGACLSCLAEPSTLPTRVKYLAAQAVLYPMACDTCGKDTLHYMTSNLCSKCFDTAGRPRSRSVDHDRGLARENGWPRYAGTCATHGSTDHWTRNGKCSVCFTEAGMVRRRKAMRGARAEARAAGKLTYTDKCTRHGSTKFGVRYGVCLKCHTVDGTPRKQRPVRE